MVAVVDDESSDLPESSESSSSGSSLDDGVSDAVARKTLAKGRTELPEERWRLQVPMRQAVVQDLYKDEMV